MAQKKYTQLTEETTPLATDITAFTKDPAGTPVSRKGTWQNVIKKAHGLSDGWQKIVSGVMTTVGSLTKSDVGLGNVDNTSDANKPVSTAQQSALDLKINLSEKGSNSGVAELDSGGKVPSAQLPSFVDDVLEYANLASFPVTGEASKIYIDLSTNKTYRWSGSVYVEVGGGGVALGETSSTAYRGDRGKTAYDHSQLTSGNPHAVTKGEVGLGNVTNDVQIPKSLVDAKGDLLIGTSNDTPNRLAVGTNNMVLMADSRESSGLKWVNEPVLPYEFANNDWRLLSYGHGTGYSSGSPSSSSANTNNHVQYTPFLIERVTKTTDLALYCVTANAGASAVLRMGIYSDNNGRPGTIVQDAGTASINTTGLKQLTFTEITLEPGRYWVAIVAQNIDTAGANPAFARLSATNQAGGEASTPPATNNMFGWFYTASISGAFASNPTVFMSRGLAANVWHVWLKVTG